MQNNRLKALLMSVWFIMSGCASTKAPTGWLNDPEDIPKDVFGAWVDITARSQQLSGELIAVGPDSVFIADEHLHAIAVADVLDARVTLYDSGTSLAWGTLGGTVLALSNGLLFLASGPMWIVGGSIAAVARSYNPIYDARNKDLNTLAKFARFPQGLPSTVDRDSMRGKAPKK